MVRRNREHSTDEMETDQKPDIEPDHEALDAPEDDSQDLPQPNGTQAHSEEGDAQDDGSREPGSEGGGDADDEEPAAGTSRPPRPSAFVRDVDGYVPYRYLRSRLKGLFSDSLRVLLSG